MVTVRDSDGFDIRPEGLTAIEQGRQGVYGGAVAVIGGIGANDALPRRAVAGNAQGQLVGLGARTGKKNHRQRVIQGGRQLLTVIEDGLVQIPRVDVQHRSLAVQRIDDTGMAVADSGHIVVGIEIAFALGIGQPDPLAFDNVQGRVVKKRRRGSEQLVAALQ